MKDFFTSTVAIVIVAVIFVGGFTALAIGTQGFGFFLQSRQNNFQNHLFQHSYGTLTGDQAAMSSDFHALYQDQAAYGDNSTPARGDGNDICRIAANMIGGGFSLAPDGNWISLHCSNGTLNNSPL